MGKVINTTSGNLKQYKEKQLQNVKNAIADTATDIEIEATRKAPRAPDKGDIFIHINKKISNKGFKGEVGIMGENKLAAYLEFGTGLSAVSILASYPQYVKDVAMAFYVNGKGTLKGKPYFYPAVFKNITIFKRELKRIADEKESDK